MDFAWDCVFQVRVTKMKFPWDYIWLLIHLTGTFDIEYKLSFEIEGKLLAPISTHF